MKLLKTILFVVIAIIVVLIAAIAYIASTFNPNDYKQQVIDLVKKEKQRDLKLDGDISLTFWPKVGANLGKIAISEQNSADLFASVESAKVALSVMPLLKKQLVVDTVYIDGATANIIKRADGSTNYDDLAGKSDSSDDNKDDESATDSQAIQFNVQGINISNSAVNYIDETANARYTIKDFNMKSGHIALAEPVDIATDFHIEANQPALNAKVNVKGNFTADPETQHYVAKNLDAAIAGRVATLKEADIQANGSIDATLSTMNILVDGLALTAKGKMDGADLIVDVNAPALEVLEEDVSSDEITLSLQQTKTGEQVNANLVIANMKGSPTAVTSSGISGEFNAAQGARKVAGKFNSPFKGNIKDLIFDLPKLAGNLDIIDPALPNGGVKGNFNIGLHTDVGQENVKTDFALDTDITHLKGDVAVNGFKTPKIKFDLNAGTLNLNELIGSQLAAATPAPKEESSEASTQPDLSALKTLFLDGHVKIDSLLYDKHKLSGLNIGILADGKQLKLSDINVKLNDSKIKGNFSISQFDKPLYSFLIDIDQFNADQYLPPAESSSDESKSDKPASGSEDTPIDLGPLKSLNANGSLRIGKFQYGKTKANNIRIDLKSKDGVTNISPLSANLYDGSMSGAVKIDARNTPSFAINQSLKSISIGPLLHDAIHNDMLSGTGTLNLNVSTKGNSVNQLRKSLNGKAAMNLVDGAVKGVDIAGSIRKFKAKTNFLRGKAAPEEANATKKTDFSALSASFNIKDGVAHNNDLSMKAPIFRLGKGDSKGTIDIGNEIIDYLAKPTIVETSKGQGGKDVADLAGVSFPVKITGTFAAPKYKLDFAAVAKQAAQSKLLEKAAGDKAGAVKDVLKGDIKADTLKGLLGGKSKKAAEGESEKEEAPKAEKALKKLLNF